MRTPLMMALSFAAFLVGCATPNAEKVSEVEAVVEELLQSGNGIPSDMQVRLGAFRYLSGEGFLGPVWNIQGYDYLQADRDAVFEKGTIPVRIVVADGRKTNPGAHQVVVQTVERDRHSLYLANAPVPKSPTEGLYITVSHPNLK